MFAYVPARGGSKRIPRKNVRALAGVPIIGHVINTLSQLDFIDRVYVSTEDAEIAAIAATFGAECLELRQRKLAEDAPGFIDLIRQDVPRFSAASAGDEEVLFVLATAALLPSSVFVDAHQTYLEGKPDVLMSCESFHMSPFWAMTEKDDGFWQPIFPESVLVPSADLPPTVIDAGLFYFFSLSALETSESLKLVDRLQAYVVPVDLACDVDTEADWHRLEEKFSRLRNLQNSA